MPQLPNAPCSTAPAGGKVYCDPNAPGGVSTDYHVHGVAAPLVFAPAANPSSTVGFITAGSDTAYAVSPTDAQFATGPVATGSRTFTVPRRTEPVVVEFAVDARYFTNAKGRGTAFQKTELVLSGGLTDLVAESSRSTITLIDTSGFDAGGLDELGEVVDVHFERFYALGPSCTDTTITATLQMFSFGVTQGITTPPGGGSINWPGSLSTATTPAFAARVDIRW